MKFSTPEIATAIRTVADIRRVFTYNAQKALVVRASVDAMALAEKLEHDLDKPKSEVVIDVIVMQDVFAFQQTSGDPGRVGGRLAPTGIRPKLLEKLERNGMSLPLSMFHAPVEANLSDAGRRTA